MHQVTDVDMSIADQLTSLSCDSILYCSHSLGGSCGVGGLIIAHVNLSYVSLSPV